MKNIFILLSFLVYINISSPVNAQVNTQNTTPAPAKPVLTNTQKPFGLIKDIPEVEPLEKTSSSSKKNSRDESLKLAGKMKSSKFFRYRLFGFQAVYNRMLLGENANTYGNISGGANLMGLGILVNLDLKNYLVSSIGERSRKKWLQLGLQVGLGYSGGIIETKDRKQDMDNLDLMVIVKYYFPLKEMGLSFGSNILKKMTPFAGMGPGIIVNLYDVIEKKKDGFTYSGPAESDFLWMFSIGSVYEFSQTLYLNLNISFGLNLSSSVSDYEENLLSSSNLGMFSTRVGVLYPF